MVPLKRGEPGGAVSTMESVLSLDDGNWPKHAVDSCPPIVNEAREDPFQFVGVKQPPPPPVLAQVQQEFAPISPSKVADPRPGPAKPSQDGTLSSSSYQHLHVVGFSVLIYMFLWQFFLVVFCSQIMVMMLIAHGSD